jgi:hypothetical protein
MSWLLVCMRSYSSWSAIVEDQADLHTSQHHPTRWCRFTLIRSPSTIAVIFFNNRSTLIYLLIQAFNAPVLSGMAPLASASAELAEVTFRPPPRTSDDRGARELSERESCPSTISDLPLPLKAIINFTLHFLISTIPTACLDSLLSRHDVCLNDLT